MIVNSNYVAFCQMQEQVEHLIVKTESIQCKSKKKKRKKKILKRLHTLLEGLDSDIKNEEMLIEDPELELLNFFENTDEDEDTDNDEDEDEDEDDNWWKA